METTSRDRTSPSNANNPSRRIGRRIGPNAADGHGFAAPVAPRQLSVSAFISACLRPLPLGIQSGVTAAALQNMKATILSVLAAAALLSVRLADAAPDKPNFLIIVADDMGFSDVGCYGGEIATPNLDKLASGGLRFTQFYNTARCWPTRSSILTGYYAQQVRMDPPKGLLPPWARLLPHYLKPLGYRCYHSGKWHVPGAPKTVADGGFDHSYRLEDHNRYFSPQKHTEDDAPLAAVPSGSGYYATTAMADYAIKYLKEHASEHAHQPFFLYLAFIAPHFPLHALPEDIARYRDRYLVGWDAIREQRWKRMREMGLIACALSARQPDVLPRWNLAEAALRERIGPGEAARAVAWNELTKEQAQFQAVKMAIHAAMVDRMDREIGRVLDQVRAMGQFDNTLIFFLSDNGASAEQIIRGEGHDPSAPPGSARSFLCLGPGWSTASNTPLRMHKSWVHEGGIATPLIVHWPNGIAARGELRRDLGHVVDFAPTLLEVAGGKPSLAPGAPPLPGKSLVPAFARDGAVTREFLFFDHIGNHALRMGDWKLVSAGAGGGPPKGGTPNSPPKGGTPNWELYNLSADRCEMRNLAAEHPERVREMAEKWQALEIEFRQQAGEDDSAPAKKSGKRQ